MYWKCTGKEPNWRHHISGNQWCSAKLECGRCISDNKCHDKSIIWDNFNSSICEYCKDRFICYTMSDQELWDYNSKMVMTNTRQNEKVS
jgi:hypothetical protein